MTSTVELPWERWPEADRALWDALVAQGGPLDDAGALSHLRPATLGTLRRGYAQWLAWLRASRPEVLSEPPERRATAERLSAWMDSLAHLAPASRLTFLDAPVRVLSRAAPDLDWKAQRRLQGAVRRAAARSPGSRKLGGSNPLPCCWTRASRSLALRPTRRGQRWRRRSGGATGP
jgi:hypothetical protein